MPKWISKWPVSISKRRYFPRLAIDRYTSTRKLNVDGGGAAAADEGAEGGEYADEGGDEFIGRFFQFFGHAIDFSGEAARARLLHDQTHGREDVTATWCGGRIVGRSDRRSHGCDGRRGFDPRCRWVAHRGHGFVGG